MGRFILGTVMGGTLMHARYIGKNMIEHQEEQKKQQAKDRKKLLNEVIEAVPNLPTQALEEASKIQEQFMQASKTPKSSSDIFFEQLKEEYTCLEAGVPIVASNILNKTQQWIESAAKAFEK